MHFHKYPYPANFEFPSKLNSQLRFKTRQGTYRVNVKTGLDDIYHLQVTGKGWEENDSQAGIVFPTGRNVTKTNQTVLSFHADGSLNLSTRDGKTLLATYPSRFFGQSGHASVFEFIREKDDQFYGMGEKWSGLEHSGKTTKFWNTDVWGDFNSVGYIDGKPAPDPVYVSVPYLILKRGNTYLGLLLDNPHATFISTGFNLSIANQMKLKSSAGTIHLGAEVGQPNLYLIYGPSLAALTRKLQKLVGVTPLPPAWSLGYHQCRWGYQSEADLLSLDKNFRKHGIPVDGLWLDIDYMNGYRVFTFDKKHFPAPAKAMAKFAEKGRKVIPIIDPGVKFEKGYGVYDRGHRAKAFCENLQGHEYVGLVWPGETVFPDYSIESARKWWAKEVKDFAKTGIYGAWLDMNDPSTGPVENHDMLFEHGTKKHGSFHNQYALGMAMASREGFLAAHPDSRPFMLCRSGFIGTSRYTAIWTGDNYSNYHHLKSSIATTLNLALSGIPFNGPDAGGFGGDTYPELICDWYKAGFLFPVFRNHSMINTRQQEPWAFDTKTLTVLRRFIQLRYRLRPYLYQLFSEQEKSGEAILRPLFYDFADTAALPLGKIDDQFMVGPHIMQAPFVQEKLAKRSVVLPGKQAWYDVTNDRWIQGNQTITVAAQRDTTPLYIRDGAILPLARLKPQDHAFKGAEVDFHIFLSGNDQTATTYTFDDGSSFAYKKGKRSEVVITAQRQRHTLSIATETISDGFGSGKFTFSTTRDIKKVLINGKPAKLVAAQGINLGEKALPTWMA